MAVNNCKVGVLAVENFVLVDVYFSKPWTKLFAVGLGVAFAYLYSQILEYRELATSVDKSLSFPKIDMLHKRALLSHLMFFVGLTIFIFDLLIGHPAIAAPYEWSKTQNILYFTLCRFSFTFAFVLLLLPVFLGHKTILQHALSHPVFLAAAKVVFFVALTHPIIIALLYNR